LHRRFILFARFLEVPVPSLSERQKPGPPPGFFFSERGGAICHSEKLTEK
jgi:hypothetical protein